MIICDSCGNTLTWIGDTSFQEYGLCYEEHGEGIIQEFDCNDQQCLTFRYLVYRKIDHIIKGVVQ
jgi:hypothetical protein